MERDNGGRSNSAYRLDIDGELPITTLIHSRLEVLRESKVEVVRRMGYKKVEKGIRRIDALLAGNLTKYAAIGTSVSQGLAIDKAVLDEAVRDTYYVQWARDDRAYREAFIPHVVWHTTLSIPSPIAVAGFINARRFLFWYPDGVDAARISDTAVAVIPKGVVCFGQVIGFYVNYTPDCAVRFNTQGDPLELLVGAKRPGYSSASVGGRLFTSESLGQAVSDSDECSKRPVSLH